MASGRQLRLVSKEGEEFSVEVEVACKSQLIKNMVEDSGAEEEIPLPTTRT